MEHYVSDTELMVPDRKPADPTIKRAIPVPGKTKEKPRFTDGVRHPVKVTKIEPVEETE